MIIYASVLTACCWLALCCALRSPEVTNKGVKDASSSCIFWTVISIGMILVEKVGLL